MRLEKTFAAPPPSQADTNCSPKVHGTGHRVSHQFVFDSHFLLFYIKFMSFQATTSNTPALARRLSTLSRVVRGLSLAAIPILLSVPVLLLLHPQMLFTLGIGQTAGMNLAHLAHGELTLATRARMAGSALPQVLIGLVLLWQLWALFGEYLRGAVFSARALRCLNRCAWLLLALSLAQPLSQALMSVAISWDNPPGQRVLMVTLTSNDYALVLGALVFIAIARVMTEAARLAEENEGFV